jgi:hypothetical protein
MSVRYGIALLAIMGWAGLLHAEDRSPAARLAETLQAQARRLMKQADSLLSGASTPGREVTPETNTDIGADSDDEFDQKIRHLRTAAESLLAAGFTEESRQIEERIQSLLAEQTQQRNRHPEEEILFQLRQLRQEVAALRADVQSLQAELSQGISSSAVPSGNFRMLFGVPPVTTPAPPAQGFGRARIVPDAGDQTLPGAALPGSLEIPDQDLDRPSGRSPFPVPFEGGRHPGPKPERGVPSGKSKPVSLPDTYETLPGSAPHPGATVTVPDVQPFEHDYEFFPVPVDKSPQAPDPYFNTQKKSESKKK